MIPTARGDNMVRIIKQEVIDEYGDDPVWDLWSLGPEENDAFLSELSDVTYEKAYEKAVEMKKANPNVILSIFIDAREL